MKKNDYRLHKNDIEELKRLLNKANSFSFNTTIKQFLHFKFTKKDVAFWPNAQIVYAFSFDDHCSAFIKKQISLWEKRNFVINEYDDIFMAYILLTKTNLLNDMQIKKIKENVKLSLSNYFGKMIPYRNDDVNKIYIDLLGMVPQFLISCGVQENDKKSIEWGVRQFTEFIKNATDDETGLPYHAYDLVGGNKLGIIGWGRALGWLLIGLSESIISLSDKYSKEKNELIDIYNIYLEKIKKYQRCDGGFSWQLQAKDGPLDSSATAMILQSMYLVNNTFGICDKYNEMMKKMMMCLELCYNDGRVENCSAECGGVGVYPQNYGSHVWSVAPYLICKALSYNIDGSNNVWK